MTIINTELTSIVSIWSVVGFKFLSKRLFGRILTFYMCKYVDFLAYFIFTYINMYEYILILLC